MNGIRDFGRAGTWTLLSLGSLCLALACSDTNAGGPAGTAGTTSAGSAGLPSAVAGSSGAPMSSGGAPGSGGSLVVAGHSGTGLGGSVSNSGAGAAGALPDAGRGGSGSPAAGGANAGPPAAGHGGSVGGSGPSMLGGSAGISAGGANTGGTTGGMSAGAAGQIASAGSGGAPPAGGFDPCPMAEPCKILPLGDSITDGIGSSGGGYRVELFSKAKADGKNITFVGGSMNGPSMVAGAPFPRAHEGHSGWTIQQIDGIVPSPALDPMPHIVLLHIGTNDMARTPQGAAERLEALIDQILTTLPRSLLVVSTIIPLPLASSQVSSFNAAIPAMVDERSKAGKHIVLVDQFKDFPTSELGDGVHPNQAGYARMAGVWYTAVKPYLH